MFFVLVLSVLALVALAIQRLAPLSPESIQILEGFDVLVCAVFFFDFIVTLVRAERKWRYVVTWGWLDLLSAVPTVASLRWARSARIIWIFRLLRALRAARLLASSFVG
ncbi:MAG: ion transporter, partial [Thermoanaerobaculia bacterium]